jgi:hypothetical protein
VSTISFLVFASHSNLLWSPQTECITLNHILKGVQIVDKLLVLTVVAEVLLISIIMVIMGRRRFRAARNKEISLGAFRTMDLAGANEGVITASRNFDNQFQMPMLFMFGVVLVLQFQLADVVFVLIGALYVALRLLHSIVHITSNHVRRRFNLFLLSCVVLWAFWIRFVILLLG